MIWLSNGAARALDRVAHWSISRLALAFILKAWSSSRMQANWYGLWAFRLGLGLGLAGGLFACTNGCVMSPTETVCSTLNLCLWMCVCVGSECGLFNTRTHLNTLLMGFWWWQCCCCCCCICRLSSAAAAAATHTHSFGRYFLLLFGSCNSIELKWISIERNAQRTDFENIYLAGKLLQWRWHYVALMRTSI